MNDRDVKQVAARFIEAIVWGEHVTVWELLSQSGREHVLEAGARRGMDAVLAARLRQGTSSQEESDGFLTGLLHGLRVDFSAVDLDHVEPASVADRPDGRVEVQLECPAPFAGGQWAAGSLILSEVETTEVVTAQARQHPVPSPTWLVDRVLPVVSRSS